MDDILNLSNKEELVLLTMMTGARYGLEIIDMVSDASDGRTQINIGSLYPMLDKFKNQGLLESVKSEQSSGIRNGHRRKYYALTDLARQILFETYQQRQVLFDWTNESWQNSS